VGDKIYKKFYPTKRQGARLKNQPCPFSCKTTKGARVNGLCPYPAPLQYRNAPDNLPFGKFQVIIIVASVRLFSRWHGSRDLPSQGTRCYQHLVPALAYVVSFIIPLANGIVKPCQ